MVATQRPSRGLDPPLTVEEVARLLGVTKPTVRDWLRDGKIRGVKVGIDTARRYRWRIPRSEVERLIN